MNTRIIVYPRSYNKRGDESKHSIFGVNQAGEAVNIKLRVPESIANSTLVPSVAEFSRNDRKAKLACQSHELNGPDNRHGVLLFSHCELDEVKDGVSFYVSKWANVISVDADSPLPIIGIGRISVNKKTNGILTARRNVERMERDGQTNTAEYKKVLLLSEDKTQYHYSAILYDFEDRIIFPYFDKESFIPVAEGFIDKNTKNGITGGFYIRIQLDENDSKEFEVFSKYVVGIQRYQTGLEAALSFIDANNLMLSRGKSFTIIALRKINSGPRGNIHFGQDHKYSQIIESFDSDSGKMVVRNMVVRVSYFEDSDNTLLSRYYLLDDYAKVPFEYSLDEKPIINETLVREDPEIYSPGYIIRKNLDVLCVSEELDVINTTFLPLADDEFLSVDDNPLAEEIIPSPASLVNDPAGSILPPHQGLNDAVESLDIHDEGSKLVTDGVSTDSVLDGGELVSDVNGGYQIFDDFNNLLNDSDIPDEASLQTIGNEREKSIEQELNTEHLNDRISTVLSENPDDAPSDDRAVYDLAIQGETVRADECNEGLAIVSDEAMAPTSSADDTVESIGVSPLEEIMPDKPKFTGMAAFLKGMKGA